MKRTNSPTNKIKCLISLLICWTALLLPHVVSAQSGTLCSNAIAIIPNTAGYTDSLQLNQNEWFTFQPTTADVKIVLTNLHKTQGFVSSIQALGGSCSGLYLLADSAYESTANDSTVLTVYGLNAFETYWIKIRRQNPNNAGQYAPFTLKIRTFVSVVTVCSCGSLFASDSTNTCQAVCNGGFDLYNNPSFSLSIHGQIERACPWGKPTTSPSTTIPSPDLFNSFNSAPNFSVPTNGDGTEASATPPNSGKSGYAGIYCYYSPQTNIREYITVPLNYTLINSKQYIVSFKVSLAEQSGYAVKNIGAYITNGIPTQSNNTSFNLATTSLQAYSSSVISNTTGWTTISGVFTASGNMNYLTIGQMTSDANASPTVHTPASNYNPTANLGAYYYIDDVSILPYPDSLHVTVSPSTSFCNGSTITLVAQTNVSNAYYFTWLGNPSANAGFINNHNDTVYAMPTDTVLYTNIIHLANYGGCTISDTVTAHWKPGPICNAGANQSVCLGANVTLSGSASGAYTTSSWTDISGTPICSSCTSYTITPTTSGQYVFTATNATTGCTDKDTVQITVTPLTVAIVSSTGLGTCDPNSIPFMTSPSNYTSWSWSTNAGTYSGTTNDTLMALWASDATGTVSVTVTDANGCQGSATLTVPPCCKANAVAAFINTNSTAQTVMLPVVSGYCYALNQSIDFNGIFHVNANTRLENCTIKFGPNAKIIVDPGFKFELKNTDLYSCTDMWDGIYVDGTNSASEVVVINGSTIEDAKNAIVSTNGGKFTIDGTSGTNRLNKNNIAILVRPYQGTHPGTIKATIISCDAPGQQGASTFTSSGSNCRAPVNAKAYCGIYIDSCSNITIGDSASISNRNLFERQKFGIYSKNSNVKVWNNNFKYFLTGVPPNPNAALDGVAIYAKGTPSLTRTLTVGRAGTYKAHNLIRKCTVGVMAENGMNLSCEYNRVDSIANIGIYCFNVLARNILINKDSITEFTGTGISCRDIPGSTITITNNELNQTVSPTPSSFGFTGIFVGNSTLNLAATPVLIQNNVIKRIRNGIWVSNVAKSKVFDNSITFFTNQVLSVANPGIGIKAENAHSGHIRNNSIASNSTSNPTLTLYDKLFGIHVTGCLNDTITKNNIVKCGSGIYLKGTDSPLMLGCNTLNRCYYGINFGLTSSGQTSVSTSDQFRWINPTTGAIVPTGNSWISTVSSDLKGQLSTTRSWYYSGTAPTNGMASGSLTGNAPTLTANADKCNLLLSAISPITSTEMRNALLEEICKSPRSYDTLSQQYHYLDSMFAYRMLRDNPSWKTLGTADDTYYSSFYTNVSSTNLGILADVEDSIYLRTGLSAAATALAGVVPNSIPEANRKAVLEIYLATWAIDSMDFDSTQAAILLAIANQAPISGGSAVFDARNMLYLEVHDSSALRIVQVPVGSSPTGHIYPNPSTGVCMLQYELKEGESGVMELYDVSGRMIQGYKLATGTSVQQFDVSGLPNGLYFCAVKIDGEAILTDKFILIKE